MTKDEIQAKFDGFIEYPQGSDKRYVTTASTLFFAHHIAKMAVKREREKCAKVADRHSTCANDTPNVIAVAIRSRTAT